MADLELLAAPVLEAARQMILADRDWQQNKDSSWHQATAHEKQQDFIDALNAALRVATDGGTVRCGHCERDVDKLCDNVCFCLNASLTDAGLDENGVSLSDGLVIRGANSAAARGMGTPDGPPKTE